MFKKTPQKKKDLQSDATARYILLYIKLSCWITLVSFVATCHTRTVWSFEQLAMSSPQGLTRAILTHSLCPTSVFTQYPVATSQILMVLSLEALTTKSPCGTNATELTLWSWPCMVFTQANDWWKSHSLMDMSALQETSSLPETSNATSCTLSVWPFSVLSKSPLSKSHTWRSNERYGCEERSIQDWNASRRYCPMMKRSLKPHLNCSIFTGGYYKTKNRMENNSIDGGSVSSQTVLLRRPRYPFGRWSLAARRCTFYKFFLRLGEFGFEFHYLSKRAGEFDERLELT